MAEAIRVVQGDTYPDIDITVIDVLTQDVVNLNGSTTKLYIRPEGGSTVTTITGSLPNGGTDGLTRFQIPTGGSNPFAAVGNFEGEVEVTFANGRIQTVYEKLRFICRSAIG